MSRLTSIGLEMAQSKYAGVQVGNSSDLEAQVANVSVEAADLEAECIVAEGVSGVVASLEAIAMEAEASIAEGGYDRAAAGMMQVAVQNQLDMVGVDASSTVPSMESFGGSGTRVEATQVSVEAIKEKAQQFWKFIVKKYKEIREKILKWFKSVFSTAAQLKSRATKVAKKAADKKGTKKEDQEEIDFGGAAKHLMTGTSGKVDVAKLKANVTALKELANSIFQDHGVMVKDMAETTEKMLSAAAGLDKEKWEKGEAKDFLDGGKLFGIDVPDYDLDKFKGTTGGEYLGARDIEVKKGDGGAGDVAGLKSKLDGTSVRYDVAKNGDKAIEVADDQKFEAFAPDASRSIADEVVVVAEAVLAFESNYFKFQKDLEGMEKAAEKLAKVQDKVSPNQHGAAANKVCRSAYELVMRMNQNPATAFTAATIASAKAALDVCEKSLAQYD